MATYKVLQDIEGEDKLIAWLTPKQAIYAAIVFVSAVAAFFMAKINIALVVPWLFPILIFGFLAAPLGRDQPNDVWLAAQIRFYLKNRKRIWDQSGMQELVHITVPKRIERIYTDGLDQNEVRSRLKALSTTIDSRGWAVKNAAINLSVAPQFSYQINQPDDDRLVSYDAVPMDVPISDVTVSEDILDEEHNSVAHRFDEQIKTREAARREKIRANLQKEATTRKDSPIPNDYYYVDEKQQPEPAAASNAPTPLATFKPQVVDPGAHSAQTTTVPATSDDPTGQQLLEKIHREQALAHDIVTHGHEKVIHTPEELAAMAREERARLAAHQERIVPRQPQNPATQTAPDAIIKELSHSDLKVSTIASQAKHAAQANNDEVVVSLR